MLLCHIFGFYLSLNVTLHAITLSQRPSSIITCVPHLWFQAIRRVFCKLFIPLNRLFNQFVILTKCCRSLVLNQQLHPSDIYIILMTNRNSLYYAFIIVHIYFSYELCTLLSISVSLWLSIDTFLPYLHYSTRRRQNARCQLDILLNGHNGYTYTVNVSNSLHE